MPSEKGPELPETVISAITQGNKIEAIKLLRSANGVGLKEAKDMVDAYIKSRPELAIKLESMQKKSAQGLFRWIIILAGLALAASWLFMKNR